MNKNQNGNKGSDWVTGRNIVIVAIAALATLILINVIEALTGWDIGFSWLWER
jgi:hypothetical protein